MSNSSAEWSFIFDMDGVLLDTERIAMESWKRAFAEFGFDAPVDVLRSTIGIGLQGTIDICRSHFGELPYESIAEKRFEIGDAMMEGSGPPVKSGIPELLETVKRVARKIAVATSTPYEMAKSRLERTGLLKQFDAVVGGDMIENGKPAPDIYLKAAQSINSDPRSCVAFEDSGPGIQSASRAGLKVVCIQDIVAPGDEIVSLSVKKYDNTRACSDDILNLLQNL